MKERAPTRFYKQASRNRAGEKEEKTELRKQVVRNFPSLHPKFVLSLSFRKSLLPPRSFFAGTRTQKKARPSRRRRRINFARKREFRATRDLYRLLATDPPFWLSLVFSLVFFSCSIAHMREFLLLPLRSRVFQFARVSQKGPKPLSLSLPPSSLQPFFVRERLPTLA